MDAGRICAECGLEWPLDRFRDDNPNPDLCFKCRTRGVSLSFQGGKSYWHNATESERTRHALSEARAAGFDPVPTETGKGWNGAAPSTMAKIGEVSKKHGAFGGKPTGNTSKSTVGAT